jgi:hypothetical protein
MSILHPLYLVILLITCPALSFFDGLKILSPPNHQCPSFWFLKSGIPVIESKKVCYVPSQTNVKWKELLCTKCVQCIYKLILLNYVKHIVRMLHQMVLLACHLKFTQLY